MRSGRLCAWLGMLAGLWLPARAASTLTFEQRNRTEVWSGGHRVLRLPDRLSADLATTRLNEAAENGLAPIGLAALVSAWPAPARRVGVTALPVLRALFAKPYLAVAEPVIVPLDATVEVAVHGAATARGFRLAAVEPPLVDASPTDGFGALRLTGRLPGRVRLVLTRDGLSLPVWVTVKPRAASPPAELRLEVTGQPLDDAVLLAATAALESGLRRPEATTLRVTRAGDETSPVLRVQAAGGDTCAVDETLPLHLAPVRIETATATRLHDWTATEPVAAPGLLRRAALPAESTARLAWWRANGADQRLALVTQLVNLGAEPARIWVNLAATGPTDNAVWAGHKAAREYLRGHLAEAGIVYTVPPSSVYVLDCRLARPGQGCAGVADVRVLEGEAVEAQLLATGEAGRRLGLQPWAADAALDPPPAANPEIPERLPLVISADDPTLVVESEIGRQPVAHGVRHRLTLILTNPTGELLAYGLSMAPAEGVAQVVYEHDGALAETPRLTAEQPFVVMLPLTANEQRVVHLSLMTAPGSSYPLKLRLGSLDLVGVGPRSPQ